MNALDVLCVQLMRDLFAMAKFLLDFYSSTGYAHQAAVVFIVRQHTEVRYLYSKSVCPSVRLSVTFRYQWKWLNILSQFFHRTVAQSF